MPLELKVPEVGESVTEVEIGRWLKKEGDAVAVDDEVVELETDKVNQVVPSAISGAIVKILKQEGDVAQVGDVIALIEEGAAGSASAAPAAEAAPAADTSAAPAAEASGDVTVMPAAQRLLDENNLQASQVPATGPGGRLLKEDVINFLEKGAPAKAAAPAASSSPAASAPVAGDRTEEAVRMTPLRRTIAKALVGAQQTAALLTTFNEVDMTEVMALRGRYKDQFIDKHDVKLGFMSFFVKATIEALKQFPAVNAEIRGDEVIYKHYYDIGIAIGGGKGLVVPVLRNAERMSLAGVEKAIGDYAVKAKTARLN